jgi:glyoxylate/hydroxypyruvate reductase
MSTKKVLIVGTDIPKSAIDLLTDRFETIIDENPTKDAIIKNIKEVDAVFWSTKIHVDDDVINAAGDRMKLIASISAGYDHIDVDGLTKHGIKLTTTSVALKDTVANMAVLLALAASRRMQECRQHMDNGTWKIGFQWLLGQDISGSTVGIVGLGEIGQAIVKKLKPFNVKQFLYSGHREKPEAQELEAKFVTFDELLRQSDFVIAAVPLTPETKKIFNEEAFNKMKNTSIFVNIARGGIVDQPALIKALKENTIFAAGLDVMEPEPIPADHELLRLPNCVLMPHMGSATLQTRTNMALLTANNIINFLNGEQLLTPVN